MNKKSYQKLKSVAVTSLIFGMGLNLMAPKESHALMVFDERSAARVLYGNSHNSSDLGILLRIIFLWPIIILDQNLPSIPPLTRDGLVDNGYSGAQAERILSDKAKLEEKLAAEGKGFVFGEHETLSTVREGLKAVMPDASDESLDVLSQRLFIAAQSQENIKDVRVTESSTKQNRENVIMAPESTESAHSAGSAK